MLHLPRSGRETFLPFSSIGREAAHCIHSSRFSRICLGYSSEHSVVSLLTEISGMDGSNQDIGICTYQHQYRKTVLVFEIKWPELGKRFTWLCSLSTALRYFGVFKRSNYRSALPFHSASFGGDMNKGCNFCHIPIVIFRCYSRNFFPPRKRKSKRCEVAAHSQTPKIRNKML